jgi:hypothetical protein
VKTQPHGVWVCLSAPFLGQGILTLKNLFDKLRDMFERFFTIEKFCVIMACA